MIPLRKLKPLPVPNWTTREYNAKASEGYAWAQNTIEGLALKLLVPTDWIQVDYPQHKDEEGFFPVVAFLHEVTGSAFGVRYTRSSSPISPADFLDALDSRAFTHGVSYRFDDTFVAERLGKNKDGKYQWAAAYRCGEHLFYCTGEGNLEEGDIRTVARVLNSSLRFESDSDQSRFTRNTTSSDCGLILTLGQFATATSEGKTIVGVRNPPESPQDKSLEFRIELTTPKDLPKLMIQTQQAINEIYGKPIVSSMQTANLPEGDTQFKGTVKLRNFNTSQGREVTLLSGSFNDETAVFVSASYPALSNNNLAWLASRFELFSIAQSLKLTE